MLTPVAASGLVLTMIGTTVTNIAVGKPATAVATVVLGCVAALVAWARLRPVAIDAWTISPAQLEPTVASS